jgi:hypothetical protein
MDYMFFYLSILIPTIISLIIVTILHFNFYKYNIVFLKNWHSKTLTIILLLILIQVFHNSYFNISLTSNQIEYNATLFIRYALLVLTIIYLYFRIKYNNIESPFYKK